MKSVPPLRLERASYPVQTVIQTRVSDLDGNGHLNAIRIAQIYEEGRAIFHRDHLRRRVRTLVAQLTVRYLHEGFWPEEVIMGVGVAAAGRTSFHMAQAMFQSGRCIGLCDTVLVCNEGGVSVPIPAEVRARMAALALPGVSIAPASEPAVAG
ncbi:acyl-CoA thioesterase [Camelimonas abortus]|uniref:Acyl-CoA thioesterase n=1 Tax=Camelimonas abortus TaxID=1017184 RepID=A0ABV7LG99_9HYPH